MILSSRNLFKPVCKVNCDLDFKVPPDSAKTAEKSNDASNGTLNGEKPKDRVSLKHYNSKFLLHIRDKGNFSVPSKLVFSAQKNLKKFHSSKLSPKKFDFLVKKPCFPCTNSNDSENKAPLKNKRKRPQQSTNLA